MDQASRQVSSVSNRELYARWAKSYDTDGNVLQAIDDLEISQLLDQFFSCLKGTDGNRSGLRISELGCGTGRNTSKLLQEPFVNLVGEIHGLDLADEMLKIARMRCEELSAVHAAAGIMPVFAVFDALKDRCPPEGARAADGVLSTLVLEHLPIDIFFATVRKLLKKNGYLLLTNMHEEMGKRSQAGFLDVETGEKIRGDSNVYSIDEVISEAGRQGFKVVRQFKERGIDEANITTVGQRGKKWLGCKVWFGCIMEYIS